MESKTAYKIIVRGLVQGVFFRDTARKEALNLGLKGYVKNNDDGSVEIVAFGNADNIDRFARWCYVGPDSAKVDIVDLKTIDVKENYKDFRIIY